MKRLFLILFFLAGAALVASAQNPALRFGVEWGTSGNILSARHFNYLTDDGMRIDDSGITTDMRANMFAIGKIGVRVADFMTVSLCSGYQGVSRGRRIVPITGRVTVTPYGCDNDGFMAFIDSGIGIHSAKDGFVLILAKAGGGYRYNLDKAASIDFQVGAHLAVDHPDVWDPDEQTYVPAQRLMVNDAAYIGLSFSVSLNF